MKKKEKKVGVVGNRWKGGRNGSTSARPVLFASKPYTRKKGGALLEKERRLGRKKGRRE